MQFEQGVVDAIFLQHEFQFLTQGLINLPGDTSQQLFPRHGQRLTAQRP
jgi:hypothetical protein